MEQQKIKVAVVGAGGMAREHLRAFDAMDEVSVRGIYSRTRQRAEALAAEFHIPSVCASVEALYVQTQADLVIIAVSELALHGLCTEAFKYPWTCLLEKPAGYNLRDAEAIAAEARMAERVAFVGLNRRHYASTRAVLTDLGRSEAPRLIQVYDQEDPAPRLRDRPAEVVRNWMYANSIHVIDYLTIFGRGEIRAVTPVVKWNPSEPRFVAAKIEYSSGDIGLYTAVWNGPGPWSASVTTQQRRWELRPLEQGVVQVHGSRKLEPLPADRWDTDFKPGLRRQAEEAVRAVLGLSHSLPTLDEGLKSVKLVHAIYGA